MYKFIIKYINFTNLMINFKKLMYKKGEGKRYVFSKATLCPKLQFVPQFKE
jgi:hypothetical protein